MTDGLSPQATLLRGFALEFLSCHDSSVVPRIMDPQYRLAIGAHVFDGRDAVYLPATAAQLAQFPGLSVTVHDAMLGPDVLAMRFTEHGVSRKHPGRAAAWGGVTMFRLCDGRLRQGWADEDYFARKRQLATGRCDVIEVPHPAPWDLAVEAPDENTEQLVRGWLRGPRAFAADHVEEISCEGPSFADLISVEEFAIEEVLSAGERAAFRVTGRGRYAGGFADIHAGRRGQPITLSATGMARIANGRLSQVRVAFDRLGLHRSLLDPQ